MEPNNPLKKRRAKDFPCADLRAFRRPPWAGSPKYGWPSCIAEASAHFLDPGDL